MRNIALPWLVLADGGGASLAGLVFTMGTLPYLLFGLFAGAAGDRRSRKKLMLAVYPLQALCAGIVPFGVLCRLSGQSRVRSRVGTRLKQALAWRRAEPTV